MVSLASVCAKKEKDTKLRLLEGWGLATVRTSDCVRRKGVFPDTECPRDPFVLEIHTHIHREL